MPHKGLAVGAAVVGLYEGLGVGVAVVGLDEGLAVGESVVDFYKLEEISPTTDTYSCSGRNTF